MIIDQKSQLQPWTSFQQNATSTLESLDFFPTKSQFFRPVASHLAAALWVMANLPGARSGGVTNHIQGPHLVPNVGREAMLVAEVVRRKPKSKAKPETRITLSWIGLVCPMLHGIGRVTFMNAIKIKVNLGEYSIHGAFGMVDCFNFCAQGGGGQLVVSLFLFLRRRSSWRQDNYICTFIYIYVYMYIHMYIYIWS